MQFILFILFIVLAYFILLIIGYILDIKKDPYFIRVRKELSDVKIEYIVDV
jgi:type IV secretory pathway component VirB8